MSLLPPRAEDGDAPHFTSLFPCWTFKEKSGPSSHKTGAAGNTRLGHCSNATKSWRVHFGEECVKGSLHPLCSQMMCVV